MNLSERFSMIRRAYEKEMPEIERMWKAGEGDRIDPYFVDWLKLFTPIEFSVWQDIRGAYLPLFPQLPVLNYFVDFGNHFVKVAIECDGKQWHNPEKDGKRDRELAAEGWIIYRVPGSVCNRVLPAPWELDRRELSEKNFAYKVDRWFTTTASGVMYAIKQQHFDKALSKWSEEFYRSFSQALSLHRSKAT